MDTSAIVVVIIGTLLFVGFAVWGAFHSHKNVKADKRGETQQMQNQTQNSHRFQGAD